MKTVMPRNSASKETDSIAGTSYDLEFQYDISTKEYPHWWKWKNIQQSFFELPENALWNCYICLIVLAAILWDTIDIKIVFLDEIYNISYAIHVLAIAYHAYVRTQSKPIERGKLFGIAIDIWTFSHYFYSGVEWYRFVCYYTRLHRPFGYLWTLTNYNLKGSVVGTTLKYCYIFMVLRVTCAIVWLLIDAMEKRYMTTGERAMQGLPVLDKDGIGTYEPVVFLSALYIVNKMFIPIGPSVIPENDVERITCLLVMLTGCLVVTGAAVASLSLVISLYMRPEETFRARYRLIIKEMQESHILPSQREKVKTFYKMYWHKQKAVSATQLLPTFPPTLPASIYTEIYFEAMQKSKLLCDLSYEFLSEIAKKMETKLYIPGDTIMQRSSRKSSIIFISYGDVEMMTAEDDSTAILRMTRGTILTPYGVCTPVALCRTLVEVRAATFCTAHVLNASDLWQVTAKYGRGNFLGQEMLDNFEFHIQRVKRHYNTKIPEVVNHKSSILHFKRCLMALKEAKDADGNLLLDRTDFFLEIAGSYVMRNRADASLTDEADAICLRPTFPCILQPESSLQFAWNLFVAGLIITVCFVHPYYLVYKKEVPIEFRFFDYMATIIYTIDVIVHLSTGDNVEDGVPITFSQTSSQQMRSTWFLFDALATLPIFEFVGQGHFAGINKLLKLPKVFRVLKGIEDICVYHSNIIRFLSYTLLLFIACYLIAALQQGVMCYNFGYCLVTNFTHSPFWKEEPLDEETVGHRLSFAMYWAISMIMFTTHKETWGTSNWNNVLFTMFVLELCIVLRIFMEAVYSATIMVTTTLRDDYDASIEMVKSCFIRNNVDPMLRQRFITYLELCWYTDKAYFMTNKRSIFYDLPSHVYQDIVAKQRSKYLLNIPFMKYLHKETLKTISSRTRLFYASPNEIIVNTGDISNEMYVIKQGICELLCPVKKTIVAHLGEKKHFAVLLCLLRLPAYYTVRAVTHVEIFTISRRDLIHVTEIPQIKDAMEYTKELPEYRTLQQHRAPFTSYVPPAPTPNTEHFKLPRKHEPDYDFLHPFYRLGFLSMLRYMFPRFTIRPDGKYLMRYEWFRALCAFLSAMVFPAYAYMELYWPWLHRVAFLLDVTAYFDVLQRMLIGYFNEQGILVYHPVSTASHYLRGAFITDLFGCMPWENLEAPEKLPDGRYRITHTKQFLMLGRLLQLYRLPSAMLILQKYVEREDILIVLRAIPLFMVLLNVLTGFIVLYSVDVYFTTNGEKKSWSIEPIKDEGGSWINLFEKQFRFNINESLGNLHLATYFWVVYETSTTGYNVFNPSNFHIMRVLFLGMLFGGMMITYFSVRIISVRANVNKALASFQEHMKDLVVFMKREKLDPALQKEVFAYYEYNWDKMGGVYFRNVFKLCNQITLRTDAILHIYGSTFAKCPILSHGDVSLLRIVGRAVHSAHYLRGMIIINESDVISDMYFVDYGTMKIRETKEAMSRVTELNKGSVFGNLDGEETFRCPVTCVASTKVHLLRINSTVFHKIINDFPSVQNLFKLIRGEKQTHYIASTAGDVSKLWKTRSDSHGLVFGRREIIKYLFFKDQILQIYLIIVSLVCIYADVYNAGFQDNSIPLIVTLYVFDLAFIWKIILYASIPYIVKSAKTKQFLLPKRASYFKCEFKFDLVSCLPIEVLSFVDPSNQGFIFSWLRLNRMFRILTVHRCLKRYREKITVNLVLTTIVSVFIWFTLSVHTICCLWYFIGMMEEQQQPKSSWIYKDDGTSWCHNPYICSLYFILTTFTQNGVGDIMPKRQSEVVFVSILQIISTMAYMVYVGEFSNIIQYQSFRSFSFYSKYLELQEFLKNNRVSKNLVNIVNKYCLHLWRESRGMQEPYFLVTAPQTLRLSVMSAAYGNHLNKHYVFQNCEPAFLRQLSGCLRMYTYCEDMYVVKQGEITDSMYFIHKGKVLEIEESTSTVTGTYRQESCFGVIQGLIRDSPYTNSYKTALKSQVLTLCLDDWLYLLHHFPISKSVVSKHMGHDDDSGGSSPDSWTLPKRYRSRVTELMDKSTQPSPSQSSKTVHHSNDLHQPPYVDFNFWPKTKGAESSSDEYQRNKAVGKEPEVSRVSKSYESERSFSSFSSKVSTVVKRLVKRRKKIKPSTRDASSSDSSQRAVVSLGASSSKDEKENDEVKSGEPVEKEESELAVERLSENLDNDEKQLLALEMAEIDGAVGRAVDTQKTDEQQPQSQNLSAEPSTSKRKHIKVRYEDEAKDVKPNDGEEQASPESISETSDKVSEEKDDTSIKDSTSSTSLKLMKRRKRDS